MKVHNVMSKDVCVTSASETIMNAARMMAMHDFGALPVSEQDRLVGVVTDRDIAVRAVAAGKASDTPVRDIMSNEVCYCFEDQELDEIARNMQEIKVRRLPVVDREKRLVGILSLGDLALANDHADVCAQALCGISEPGGQHSQLADAAGRASA